MGCCISSSQLLPPSLASYPTPDFIPWFIVKPELFVQQSSGRVQDSYAVGEQIGAGRPHVGGFATVYEATHFLSGSKRAIKRIQVCSLPLFSLTSIFNEVALLRTLDHPSILKLYEAIIEPDTLNIVTELLRGGSLLHRVQAKGPMSEELAVFYGRQILSALAYCHERGIVHRDVKMENLMLESQANDALIKLIDFGDAIKIEPNQTLSEPIGTVSELPRRFTSLLKFSRAVMTLNVISGVAGLSCSCCSQEDLRLKVSQRKR